MWIDVTKELPQNGVDVLAHYVNDVGNHHIVRAIYFEKYAEECGGDDEFCAGEDCEKDDTYYIREGWYETNEHEDVHWFIDEMVTHWMPLPEPPEEKLEIEQ